MDYQSKLPDKALSEFVACFWKLANDDLEKRMVQILPDGYLDIIFTYIQNKPVKIVLVGLGTKPQRYTIPSGSRAYAVSFKLPAAEYLLKMPISALLDSYKFLEDHFWNLSDIDFTDLTHFVSVVQPIIKGKIDPALPSAKGALFNALYDSDGQVAVGDLALETAWNRRDINRYFRKYFGLTLKMYCDILRFRSSFGFLNARRFSAVTGYYDQSHFIRQVRNFSKWSPGQLSDNADSLFIQLTV